MMIFMVRGRLTRFLGLFTSDFGALAHNANIPHGSKNLLQRGILYRHEKILLRQGRLQARPKKTIWGNVAVFHGYLEIDQFVWARAFCEIRISCPAAVDCSGTIRKIHMRKIEL